MARSRDATSHLHSRLGDLSGSSAALDRWGLQTIARRGQQGALLPSAWTSREGDFPDSRDLEALLVALPEPERWGQTSQP